MSFLPQGSGIGPASGIKIGNPSGAYGEVLSAEAAPVVVIDSIYGVIPDEVETFTALGGSAAADGSQFKVAAGASTGSYGVLRSRRIVRYRPGRGSRIRFSARFSSGVASTQQRAGGVIQEGGLCVGFNGTRFGCLLEDGGKAEIQRLTVSAAAGGTESVTITLNGVEFTFNVTAGTTAGVATEIAAETYTGWNAYANNSDVLFIRTSNGATSDFTFENNTGGGTAAASFAQVQAGVANTETWYYLDSYGGSGGVTTDPLDGTGPSGLTFDPTQVNVFEINYKSAGAVEFSIENSSTGQLELFHRISWSNNNQGPLLDNPTLKVGWVAYNLGGGAVSVWGTKAGGFVEGQTTLRRNPRALITSATGIGTSFTAIQSIRVRPEFNGKLFLGEVRLLRVQVAVEGTKPAEAVLLVNSTLSGASWTNVNDTSSVVEEDTSATHSGGRQVGALSLAKSDRGALTTQIKLERTETLTVAVRATASTTDVTVALTWTED